jgi:hypothetical protein
MFIGRSSESRERGCKDRGDKDRGAPIPLNRAVLSVVTSCLLLHVGSGAPHLNTTAMILSRVNTNTCFTLVYVVADIDFDTK